MADLVDLNQRRVEQAASAADITPIMAMREALRQMEAGELLPTSILIICDDGGETIVHTGGPANTNEFMGLCFRTQMMMARI